MSTLRKEYWDTTNQYIIEMYKRAYDLYNNVALSVAQDLDNYNKLRFSNSGSGWSSSTNDLYKSLIELFSGWNPDWESSDGMNNPGGWNTIISSEEDSAEAREKLGQKLDNANSNSWTNAALKVWASAAFPWAAPLIRGSSYSKNRNK